jgi:hypothetical protein
MNAATPVKTFIAGALLALLVAGCSENDQLSPAGPGPTSPSTLARAAVGISLGSGRIEARLRASSADPLSSGHATWERRPDRVKFSTEVEDVTTSGAHEIRVNRRTLGFVTVTQGFGDLNLDSRRGDKVPLMRSGDLIEVFNPDKVLILSGSLR